MLLTLLRPTLIALGRYWKPFVAIQLCGVAVVVAYFYVAAFQRWLDVLGAWKAWGGLPIAMLASAISGAVVPEIAKTILLRQTTWDRRRLADIAFNGGVFALMATFADPFYTLMGRWFPNDGTAWPPVIKTAIDQFLFSAFLTLPTIAFLFNLREDGFRVPVTASRLGVGWYARRVVPLAFMCWSYWIPMCLVMYVLPASLTFVFAMFAQAAYALLLTFVAANPNATHDVTPAQADPPGVGSESAGVGVRGA
jgi:hypothetical protein